MQMTSVNNTPQEVELKSSHLERKLCQGTHFQSKFEVKSLANVVQPHDRGQHQQW